MLHFNDLVIIILILADDGKTNIISTPPGLIDDEDFDISGSGSGNGEATNEGSGSGDDAIPPYISM